MVNMQMRKFWRSGAILAAILTSATLAARAEGLSPIARAVLADKTATATAVGGGSDAATRVYGGRPAQPGQWPAQVAILSAVALANAPGNSLAAQFCGGTLIGRQWVLTAAHCVMGDDALATPAQALKVETGAVGLGDGELRAVAEVIVHDGYNPYSMEHDIALLQLAEPITRSRGHVGAIPVLAAGQPVPIGPAVVVGWGLVDGDFLTRDLIEADIQIVPNETCNRAMAAENARSVAGQLEQMGNRYRIDKTALEAAFQTLVDGFGSPVTAGMICAGTASGTRTSCKGDSGGPLMVQGADGGWLQVGIVSWLRAPQGATQECGHPGLYAVYTNLAAYYDWIDARITGG